MFELCEDDTGANISSNLKLHIRANVVATTEGDPTQVDPLLS